MTSTVLRMPVKCGNCPEIIAAGEPVALLCDGKFKRCAHCAGLQGYTINQTEVEAARHALEAEDAAKRADPKRVTYATRRPEDGFQSLRDVSTSAPLPFHDLPAKDRRRHNALADND